METVNGSIGKVYIGKGEKIKDIILIFQKWDHEPNYLRLNIWRIAS